MPKFIPRVPIAKFLSMLSAALYLMLALARFSLSGCARRAGSTPMPLTRHCSGLLRNH